MISRGEKRRMNSRREKLTGEVIGCIAEERFFDQKEHLPHQWTDGVDRQRID